jgi:hypothetical protein
MPSRDKHHPTIQQHIVILGCDWCLCRYPFNRHGGRLTLAENLACNLSNHLVQKHKGSLKRERLEVVSQVLHLFKRHGCDRHAGSGIDDGGKSLKGSNVSIKRVVFVSVHIGIKRACIVISATDV